MASAPDPNLMTLFHFTAADLEANRAGNMTPDQAERLKSANEDYTHRIGYFVTFIVLFLVVIFLAWTAVLNMDKSFQQFIGVLGLILIIGLPILIGYQWRKERVAVATDVQVQQIDIVTGIMILKMEYYGKSGFIRSATVGLKKLPLNEAQYNYLKGLSEARGGETSQKHRWRILDSYFTTTIKCSVYFTETSGTMLSMEILE